MAQATGTTDGPPARYFCHQCDMNIIPLLPDFLCPGCHSGFIEEVTSDSNADGWFEGNRGSEYEPAQRPLLHDILESIYGQFGVPSGAPSGAAPQGTTRPPDPGATGRPAATRGTLPNQSADISAQALEGIFQQILSIVAGGGGANLTGGSIPVNLGARPANVPPRTPVHHGQVNFEFPFFQMINLHGNPGDYAWGQAGLDAVISQLLNQLDSSGPAPMGKEDMERIPFSQITKDDVERNMQCSVCMDDFKLDERVRKLECSHVFHNDCILPWLQMHATCPICRTNLSKSDTPGSGSDSSRPATGGGGAGSGASSSAANSSSTPRTYDELMDYD